MRMNFALASVFIFFLGCLFLFGLNKIFVFRLIQKKLRWWIFAHWITAGIALLGKIFLVATGLQVFEGITIGKNFAENWEIIQNKTFPFPLPWGTYQLDFRSFVIAYLLAILVQTHLSFLHMYIGWTLEDKIRGHLVHSSLNRYLQLPYLETQVMKSKLRNILLLDIPLLSYSFAGGAKGQDFNQIFYQTADTVLHTALAIGFLQRNENKKGIFILLGAIIFALLFVIFLQRLLVKKEKKFKQSLDQENQKIDNLLDNIELLKKKELSPVFLKEINQTMRKNIKKREKDKFLIVANGVYPNYLLPRAIGMILFAFTLDFQATIATDNALKQLKSVLVAMRGLPTVLASNHRLANYYQTTKLPAKEKTPKICLMEPIEKIELRNVCFRYPSQKKYLLQNYSQEFVVGKITKIEGRNGFGKSTIILLILGLLKPQKGEIIINNHYDLKKINLVHWRKQIAYVSNQTLLKEGSEGEKQIQELEDTLLKGNYNFIDPQRKSQILILDEAWNSLDKNNRDQWKKKIENLTIQHKTITIVVEH
ncbi:MAG: ABC transporter permease/ATP-binding protein [Mycoplasmataceae bacterium CE_OT135]|nr:MAG: ABC transporter permease/ATP-binding protein [Mycoplasmataceae bacterium CE_OT135]